MKEIRNILVAVDKNDDGQAFMAEVAIVAKDADAHVTLLSVLDTSSDGGEKSPDSSELHQWLVEDQLAHVQAISSELVKTGIEVTIKQSRGKSYLEIIREALRGDYELIMKPAKSESGVRAALFGSTDMQIFRLCPYPVWAFKPTQNAELGKVMVAVDLLPDDQEKSALADKVLQWGRYVAGLAGSELHVVHTWSLYGEAKMRGRSVLADTVDRLVKEEERRHRQWLNEALTKNGLEQSGVTIHFYKGEANKLIPEIANATKADLLVMGTVGRTGIPGFFIGNTADSVLRQVHCSVLAVKPDGFVTPVEV